MEAVINERKANQEVWGTAALEQRRHRARQHLAAIASRRESWITRNRYYYGLLTRLLRFVVEPDKMVLSVRCGTGYHLAAVSPKRGKGVDICAEMVQIARQRNSSFDFAIAFPDKDEFREVFQPRETDRNYFLRRCLHRWHCPGSVAGAVTLSGQGHSFGTWTRGV